MGTFPAVCHPSSQYPTCSNLWVLGVVLACLDIWDEHKRAEEEIELLLQETQRAASTLTAQSLDLLQFGEGFVPTSASTRVPSGHSARFQSLFHKRGRFLKQIAFKLCGLLDQLHQQAHTVTP